MYMDMQRAGTGHRSLRAVALAAVAVLALGGGAAMAQPGGGPGHGHGGGPGGGMEMEHVLGAVKAQLNLNTSQQLAWDNALAQTKAAHEAGRANMEKIHAVMTAELAKPEPDLAAVAATADSIHAANQTLRQGVRSQWLQIYATFSPAQKAVVRDALVARMARMETMRDKMKAHMFQGG
jgi:Spy/CpxP family protein refolding chaperone